MDGLSPNIAFEVVPSPEREPGDESARAAVERSRGTVRKLRAEMDAVKKAPLPRADVKRFALAWINQHAKRGRPHIQVRHDRADIMFENAKALLPGDRYAAPVSADLLIWLFRDQLAEAMDREVDALTIEGALTRDERGPRLEALRAALLEAERREEAAIVRAAEEDTLVSRRADVSPLAVLGIRFVGAAASRAA